MTGMGTKTMYSGRSNRTGAATAVGLVILGPSALAIDARPALASIAPHAYEIAPGPIADALSRLADETGAHLVFDAAIARHVSTRGVRGKRSLEQALDELLTGTNLTYRVDPDERAVTILLAQNGATLSDASGAEALPTIDIGAESKGKETAQPGARTEGAGLGGRFTGYNVVGPAAVGKADISIMRTPYSVKVVPREVLDDQQDISVQDAIVGNVSSVQPDGDLFYDGFTIRGIPKASIFRQNLKAPSITHLQTANLQSIEVLKGPAAMLFGRLEPGGVVNLVVKRPLETPYYSIQEQAGSFGRTRTSADLTGPLTEDRAWLYRLNLSYLHENSFRDFVTNQDAFIAPTLTFHPTEQFRLNIDGEYQNSIFVADYDNTIPAIGNRPANIPISRYLYDPAVTKANPSRMERLFIGYDWTYDIAKDWSVTNRFDYTDIQWAQKISSFRSVNEATGDVTRSIWDADPHRTYLSVNLDINGKFQTGPFNHTILVGGDYHTETQTDIAVADYFGPVPAIPSINIYSPTYRFAGYTKSAYNAFFPVKQSWKGVYAQDMISFADDQLHLLLGGRYDWAEYGGGASATSLAEANGPYDPNTGFGFLNATDKAFSPRLGAVVQPAPWLSFYGSYSQSFGATNGLPYPGQPLFPPEKGVQYEAGAKAELLDKRLTASLAVFDIEKSNIVQSVAGTRFSIPVGRIRSRGVEVDVSGRIDEYWSLIGNYSYDEVRIIDDATSGSIGNRLMNAPLHSGNIWVKYDADGAFNGLSLGGGLNVVGERQGDNANTFQLPAYTLVNAMVMYRFQPAFAPWVKNLTAQLNVRNLLDEVHYTNSWGRTGIMPGIPRSFLVSLRAEF